MCFYLDKPLKPENVKAVDIFAEQCKVTWEPPKDDGGVPITGKLFKLNKNKII